MGKSDKPSSNGLVDADYVRALAEILADHELTAISIEQDGCDRHLAKAVNVIQTAAPVATAPALAAPAAAPAASAAPAAADTGPALPPGEVITSPMVGTVYLQAEPGAPKFVTVGDQVNEGDTLLIVEAMKTMNPLPAPKSGKVAAVLVEDATPVEYGEPLVVIE